MPKPIDKVFTVKKFIKLCPIINYDDDAKEDEPAPPGNPVEPPSEAATPR